MKVKNYSIFRAFSALLSIAAGAAAFAYAGLGISIATAAIVFAASYFTLSMAWSGNDGTCKSLSNLMAMIGIIAFLPIILFKGIFVALLLLLLFAQLAQNLVMKEYRQLYFGIATSFVGLCIGAAEAKHGAYLLFFLLYIICATHCLGLMHIDRELQMAGLEEWPDKTPARRMRIVAYLSLLAVALYLLMPRIPAANLGTGFNNNEHFYQNREWETESRRSDSYRDGLETPGALGSSGEGESSGRVNDGSDNLDEDAFQEMGADLYDDSQAEPIVSDGYSYNGFNDSFDIRNPDSQSERFSDQLVARMQADKGLYLRAQVFDLFDGVSWSKSNRYIEKIALERGKTELYVTSPATELVRQQIYVETILGDFIPASAVPQAINFPASVVGRDAFNQLRAPEIIREGTIYSVESEEYWYRERAFAEQEYLDSATYLQLPDNFDPRIGQLAERVAGSADSDFATAIQLEQHLRSEYEYSFESVFTSQNRTPLSKFLFEEKKGHCEYFASALTVMLRSLDIPARLVTGFSATQENPLTGYYDIYALDGHAWVEAYVDGVGWMILEPTAFYTLPENQERGWLSAEKIDSYVDNIMHMQDALPEGEQQTLAVTLAQLWQTLVILGTVGLAYAKLWLLLSWPFLLAGAILLVCLLYVWRRYQGDISRYFLHKRVNRYKSDGTERSIDFYLDSINKLTKEHRFHRRPGMTLETYAFKLEESLRVSLENADTIQNINCLKYAVSEEGKVNVERVSNDLKQLFNSLYEYTLASKSVSTGS